MKKVDITGKRFGKITALNITDKRKNGHVVWNCRCDCGNIIEVTTGYLQSGDTKSCRKCNNKWTKLDTYYECSVTNKNGDIKCFKIDIDDFEEVSKIQWYINELGYVISSKNYKHIRLHRFILNPPKNKDVDHINHDPLDNRKSMLRICTRQENSMNQIRKTKNITGYTGVIVRKNKYIAQIKYKYKHIHLGTFSNMEYAIRARLNAEKQYFGDFRIQRGV